MLRLLGGTARGTEVLAKQMAGRLSVRDGTARKAEETGTCAAKACRVPGFIKTAAEKSVDGGGCDRLPRWLQLAFPIVASAAPKQVLHGAAVDIYLRAPRQRPVEEALRRWMAKDQIASTRA